MTCSPCAESACAALCGSAPTATRGWLLIEHPGPWPAFGYPDDLPKPLARAADRLLAEGVRPQLIRRTDRTGRRGAGAPAVFLAGGDGHGRWVELIEPDALTQAMLTDTQTGGRLTTEAFRSGHGPGLGRAAGPLLLVCTHGRREVCCARFGRPVAVALAARFGPLVWETTHVGGDRFAANLVVLPQGAYFGRLDPPQAVAVAERALAGELDLDAYRGTAGHSAAAQSAEWHLRRSLAEPALAALRPLASPGPGLHRFAHLGPGGVAVHYDVRLRAEAGGYRLVEITSAG
ncbi:hypothetical protein KDL01_34995 [Actinospica durhamensis]|uniref:Sucrase ferredoxin n=1 Tax=Actinospica durhamensis TaxID=1508375 RepID=A0A941IU38_9ACTN|nr:sucrase ferredoxin [Actinospica durhamensis]MBR7838527.1 hypothetical protein [Actinospica durhamensis]